MYRLKDRVVIVTGASRGIGRATALAFAREGAKLVLAARDAEKLAEAQDEIKTMGGTALAVATDVTDERSVGHCTTAAIRTYGRIDVLVNNAGVGCYASVQELAPETLQKVFEVNVLGALRMIRSVIQDLRVRKEGQIINVSSMAGKVVAPYGGGYSASKAALNALNDALRVEVAPDGIDVILVCPGFVDTAFREHAYYSGSRFKLPRFRPMSAHAAAHAIVRASKQRTREVVLTVFAKTAVAATRLAPRLVDAAARRVRRAAG